MLYNIQEQLKLFLLNTVDSINKEELKKKIISSLNTKKPLNIKIGFDPTSSELHLGHLILFNKLKLLQKIGHHVTCIIGDFTARIGDPSGRNRTRPLLTEKEININSLNYSKQILKFLNPKKTFILFNSNWLLNINLLKIIKITSMFSLAQMLERNDFFNRFKSNLSISMHEFIYPILQGYDSLKINADIEIGGTDQLFNLLIGRNIMKKFNMTPQCILTLPIIEGTDAKEINGVILGSKMSKTFNNYISLSESSFSQFSKIMSICDKLMWKYYKLLLDYSDKDIDKLKNNKNLKLIKEKLAFSIVEKLHNSLIAHNARTKFNNIFISKNFVNYPDDTPIVTISTNSSVNFFMILLNNNIIKSIGEGKRLLKQGGIYVNGIKLNNINYNIPIISKNMYIIKIGKRRWIKIKIL